MRTLLFRNHRNLILFIGVIQLCGCALLQRSGSTTVDPDKYGGLVQVACVGDSITYGSGLASRAREAYPAQLQEMLGDQWEVRNFGVSGATMLRKGNKPYVAQVAYGDAQNYNPDVVILMLGTNDSKPINWDAHSGEFVADTLALLDTFENLPTKPRIYLALPPPVAPNRFGISEENLKQAIRPALEMIALEKSLQTIDFNEALLEDLQTLHDGVHPDARGAELMARAAAEKLAGQTVLKP